MLIWSLRSKEAERGYLSWAADFRELLAALDHAGLLLKITRPICKDAEASSSGSLAIQRKATVSGEQVPPVTHPDEPANVNVFDRPIALRDLANMRSALSRKAVERGQRFAVLSRSAK